MIKLADQRPMAQCNKLTEKFADMSIRICHYVLKMCNTLAHFSVGM